MKNADDKTIRDFGAQWTRFVDNEGWYGSLELFEDITQPLLEPHALEGKTVVDIGSGTGRIVSMLLEAGVGHVYAVEPSEAFTVLEQNVTKMKRPERVTTINDRGDRWRVDEPIDYVFSIGVVHHIPEPDPVIRIAYQSLKPGGHAFLWLYGHEGNELYLGVFGSLRKITTRLPDVLLRGVVEMLYGGLHVYRGVGKLIPLPMRSYLERVFWPLRPENRRLVIFDQLNPTYAKYYRRHEAIELLEKAGFTNVKAHQRHGYSWSVIGQKPGG